MGCEPVVVLRVIVIGVPVDVELRNLAWRHGQNQRDETSDQTFHRTEFMRRRRRGQIAWTKAVDPIAACSRDCSRSARGGCDRASLRHGPRVRRSEGEPFFDVN